MIYVDSNIFIYPVIYDKSVEKKALSARNILVKIAGGLLEAATGALTWDELTWVVRKTLGIKIAIDQGKKFLEFPNLKILPIDEKVIKTAQKIAERYKLKPRDSIHAACALANGIKEILSDDPDFDKVEEIKRIELEKY